MSFHVGSQCMHPISYAKGINDIGNIIKKTKIIPDYINVGGGLAIDYKDPIDNRISNFQTFIDIFNKNIFLNDRQLLHFELGRSIVGQCGFLISSSDLLTIEVFVKFLFCLVSFFVRIWFLNAFLRLIFPVPVNLNLFFAPDFVLTFGIILYKSQLDLMPQKLF